MEKKKEEVIDGDTETNLNLGDLSDDDLEESVGEEKFTPEAESKSPVEEEEGIFGEVAEMSEDLPVKLVAVLGKKNMLLKDLLKMKIGQAIELDRVPNEFVDITANGKLIARGELVEIEGKLGVRIIKMLK